MPEHYDVAVVGAGIVGLAHAWVAARNGKRVIVLERDQRAVGASIRNFGMVWPVGQPAGRMHELALASRKLWCDLAGSAGFWLRECGSIHLAHRADEWNVLQEFAAQADSLGYDSSLWTAQEVIAKSEAANPQHLIGGLWSPTEVCVDPREVVRAVLTFLQETYKVDLRFGTPVQRVSTGSLWTTSGEVVHADQIIIASGSDLETLFPEIFEHSGLRRCKLQMLRTVSQPNGWRIGPHLAGGLMLRHYANFGSCPSLPNLKQRIANETPELDSFGIHVMASQNRIGEIALGDSHEYDSEITPFDKSEIDELMLRELRKLIRIKDWTVVERWHGVYTKHGTLPYFENEPEVGVKIVTGLGGAGMTLSFGLAETVLAGC